MCSFQKSSHLHNENGVLEPQNQGPVVHIFLCDGLLFHLKKYFSILNSKCKQIPALAKIMNISDDVHEVTPSKVPQKIRLRDTAEQETKTIIITGKVNMVQASTQTCDYNQCETDLQQENDQLMQEILTLRKEKEALQKRLKVDVPNHWMETMLKLNFLLAFLLIMYFSPSSTSFLPLSKLLTTLL